MIIISIILTQGLLPCFLYTGPVFFMYCRMYSFTFVLTELVNSNLPAFFLFASFSVRP